MFGFDVGFACFNSVAYVVFIWFMFGLRLVISLVCLLLFAVYRWFCEFVLQFVGELRVLSGLWLCVGLALDCCLR